MYIFFNFIDMCGVTVCALDISCKLNKKNNNNKEEEEIEAGRGAEA